MFAQLIRCKIGTLAQAQRTFGLHDWRFQAQLSGDLPIPSGQAKFLVNAPWLPGIPKARLKRAEAKLQKYLKAKADAKKLRITPMFARSNRIVDLIKQLYGGKGPRQRQECAFHLGISVNLLNKYICGERLTPYSHIRNLNDAINPVPREKFVTSRARKARALRNREIDPLS